MTKDDKRPLAPFEVRLIKEYSDVSTRLHRLNDMLNDYARGYYDGVIREDEILIRQSQSEAMTRYLDALKEIGLLHNLDLATGARLSAK